MMAAGEFAPARQNLEIALKTSSEWIGDHDLYANLVDLAVRQRDRATILQYAPLAEELAARLGHELYQAIAYRAWGVAHRISGDHVAARASLNQALELFTKLNTRWQIGRTLFELAELYFTAADTAKAQDHYSRALALFAEMGAVPDIIRTQVAMESINIG